MNTNKLKSFATKARLILMEGVSRKLNYWGFNDRGECVQQMEPIAGGYAFREQVFNDPRVYPKWQNLKQHIRDQQTRKDVIEQAAYTWFNRLIAIKMLEMNGYEDEAIGFREGTHTPMQLQSAKRGGNTLVNKTDHELLKQYINDDDDENAFGLLLTDHCNRHTLLKNIFGSIDDFTELLLPNNLLAENGIISLINDEEAIKPADFKEVELIGWLYQFYIADRKDEVFAGFKKNKKARAEDIPAATQIFTPKWIVQYMVENTIGKLYLGYEPDSPIRSEMKYLVENDGESEIMQSPISDITQLTLLDPACGSGHILVVGFDLLMKMYLEQGYNKKQAIQCILDNNLYGLDIDDRAAQLARFALLLKASAHDASILSENLHVRVYAFPDAYHFSNEDLLTYLDGRKEYRDELRDALNLLNQGKHIGSALKLEMSEAALSHLDKQSKDWKQKETSASLALQEQAILNRLHPFLEVLQVLTRKYTAVVANPPYLSPGATESTLKEYVDLNYPNSKTDLFAVFIEVSLSTAKGNGLVGMINQHSWMFLSSYKNLRKEIVSNYLIDNMLHLGPRTFSELSGEVVQSTAFCIKKASPNISGTYFRLVDLKSTQLKEQSFIAGENKYSKVKQNDFLKIPGTPIAYWLSAASIMHFEGKLLSDYWTSGGRIKTHGNDLYMRTFWEVNKNLVNDREGWNLYENGGESLRWFGNLIHVVNWTPEARNFYKSHGGLTNERFHKKRGITWNNIGKAAFRFKDTISEYSSVSPTAFPDCEDNLFYYLGFLNSKYSLLLIDVINPTLSNTIGDISKLPLLRSDRENEITILVEECIKISRMNWDMKETSWDFKRPPLIKDNGSLRNAFQKWQVQVTQDFFQLHTNEQELNRIFIDIYGLREELPPEVALKDITILQDELDRNALEQLEPMIREQEKDAIELPIDKAEVMSQFISYSVGCMMGRYRLDKPGLNVAHPDPSEKELAAYTYEGRPWKIDENAILPIMGNESPFADDITYRTKEFIRVVWGDGTLTENLNFLQKCLGMDLEEFLVTKFWDYHKRMYKKRPIYWLFSSKNGAFQVLTYMHRMDKYTVQKIRQNYLHKFQAWLNAQINKLSPDEASLSRENQKKLEYYRKTQIECKEYDEILKELTKQQIEFDFDDGVVVNYAKFGQAVREI